MVRIFAAFDWSARTERSPHGQAFLSASSLGTPSDREIQNARYLSSDGAWAAVADATLHNQQSLGQELGLGADAQLGELLARGFERWGQALPERLIGDFSFVVWDNRAGRVFAARDPWGVRGLVYCDAQTTLHLATDVEQLPMSSPVPDEETILEFLTWDYRSAARTFFRGISRVPAGHFLLGDGAGIRVDRYWRPPPRDIVLPTTEDYHREFRRLFFQAVGDRLGGTRPILCHLSGGIDSSSIVCTVDDLVRSEQKATIKAVSARYPKLDCDESPFIDAVARSIRIPVESWDGTVPIWADLEDAMLDWPGGRTLHAGGTTGALDIAARDGAGALLGGSGGDQIGSSSGVLPDLVAAARWGAVLRATLFAGGGNPLQGFRRLLSLARGALPARFDGLRRGLRSLRPPNARNATFPWLSPRLQTLAAERAAAVDREEWAFTSHLQRHRWNELTSPRLGWSVERQRRAASLVQVEMRFPFLDVRLANFVLAVPYHRWPPGPYPQRIHRTILSDLLPPEILARTRKTTFQSALTGQVRAGLGRIRALMSSGTWAAEPYVDRRHALRLLVQCEQRVGSFWEHRLLWNIATIEAWLRRVFG